MLINGWNREFPKREWNQVFMKEWAFPSPTWIAHRSFHVNDNSSPSLSQLVKKHTVHSFTSLQLYHGDNYQILMLLFIHKTQYGYGIIPLKLYFFWVHSTWYAQVSQCCPCPCLSVLVQVLACCRSNSIDYPMVDKLHVFITLPCGSIIFAS